ncbi:DNA-binding response regulator [Streptococcus sp. X16XC17]|uniref:LytTR family DNA-binding domain-containing protein n=1 Tax=unclassified Streptococcus TaxID=2608887 RepID=UPI00066FD99D|nr:MULTISPECIES: LytTR family DNA-binding domain-containing protein [unclassified Streptococcus]TCD45429.1 DNA-binding response regulator [Streptococcus sp. X16XC17]
MKVSVNISDQFTEDRLLVEVRKMTDKVREIVDFVEKMDQRHTSLTVKQGEEIYVVPFADIYQLVIMDKTLYVRTKNQEFTSNLRLYQAKELLPDKFLQISQSEIINIKYLDHLQLTKNGLIKIMLKNGEHTYSSRRYLKPIKEAIGI